MKRYAVEWNNGGYEWENGSEWEEFDTLDEFFSKYVFDEEVRFFIQEDLALHGFANDEDAMRWFIYDMYE